MEPNHPVVPYENASAGRLKELRQFMVRRDGVAHREELVAQGFSSSQIKNWVRSGRLITVFRSVFAFGRDLENRNALWRAALLVAGPGSALTGRSACEALGLVKRWPAMPFVVQVASPAGQARQFRGLSPALRKTSISVVRRNLHSGDFMTVEGIRTVKPALSLIDFAGDGSDRDLWFAFKEASRLFRFGPEDVEHFSARMRHRNGAAKMRPLLALLERASGTGTGAG